MMRFNDDCGKTVVQNLPYEGVFSERYERHYCSTIIKSPKVFFKDYDCFPSEYAEEEDYAGLV